MAFNENSTVKTLVDILKDKGPLLAVSYTAAHAVVVCGAGMAAAENMTSGGLDLGWSDKLNEAVIEKEGVWVNDPFRGSDQKVGLKQLKVGFDYLAWGTKPAGVADEMTPLTNNLWYFGGKDSKKTGFHFPRVDWDF
jgi:hypothetical protein